jgi:hypothetical protein
MPADAQFLKPWLRAGDGGTYRVPMLGMGSA